MSFFCICQFRVGIPSGPFIPHYNKKFRKSATSKS